MYIYTYICICIHIYIYLSLFHLYVCVCFSLSHLSLSLSHPSLVALSLSNLSLSGNAAAYLEEGSFSVRGRGREGGESRSEAGGGRERASLSKVKLMEDVEGWETKCLHAFFARKYGGGGGIVYWIQMDSLFPESPVHNHYTSFTT